MNEQKTEQTVRLYVTLGHGSMYRFTVASLLPSKGKDTLKLTPMFCVLFTDAANRVTMITHALQSHSMIIQNRIHKRVLHRGKKIEKLYFD